MTIRCGRQRRKNNTSRLLCKINRVRDQIGSYINFFHMVYDGMGTKSCGCLYSQ